MRTSKPFLIAGVPIAGLALQYGVTSAWSPPASSPVRHRQSRAPTAAATTSTALSSSVDINIDSLHLTPELEMMTNAFSSIPDEKTRHKQLLYMASKLPPVEESVYVPENKVPGCLSTVHVDCNAEEGEGGGMVVNYVGDSDGLLTKGLLALLIRGLSGCTPEQINAVDGKSANSAPKAKHLFFLFHRRRQCIGSKFWGRLPLLDEIDPSYQPPKQLTVR